MAKKYTIRPFLNYQSEATDAVSPKQALEMVKRCEWATVGSRDDLVKVMRLLGFSPDELSFTVNYALYGAPAGTSSGLF